MKHYLENKSRLHIIKSYWCQGDKVVCFNTLFNYCNVKIIFFIEILTDIINLKDIYAKYSCK